MKLPHRRGHLLLWLVLIPALAAGLWLAIEARPSLTDSDRTKAVEQSASASPANANIAREESA